MSVHRVGPGDTIEVAMTEVGPPFLAIGPIRIYVGGTQGVPAAVSFRVPMLNVDKAWYEATRRFGPYDFHPGRCEDWNLESGGNTDLGEPLVAPFSGAVTAAANYGGGVGRVVQLVGFAQGEVIIWAGWHLHEISVEPGQIVQVGDPLGSIGNADGRYAGAHLHEQICVLNSFGIPSPTTFVSDARYDWRQPSRFYVEHGVNEDLIRRLTGYDHE